jgi:prephenate dehydratase
LADHKQVDHHLLVSREAGTSTPRRILSHTKAFQQCGRFLERTYPQVPRVSVSSTAQAAEEASTR